MTKSVFAYRNGTLCAEAIPLREIAEDVDTPFYCTSAKQLQRNYRCFTSPFEGMEASFHYSLRANANLSVLRILADYGAGAEVSSTGEMERALQAGMLPSKIVVSGLGKTRDDIAAALLAGVMQINVETLSELALIDQVAAILGLQAPVSLRLDLDSAAATSGSYKKRMKNGFTLDTLGEAMRLVLSSRMMLFKGLAVHVEGSSADGAEHKACYEKLAMVVATMRDQGIKVERLNLGGGLGASYEGRAVLSANVLAEIVRATVAPLGCALSFEPGRSIVADASVLVARVLHVQEDGGRKTLVLDAGMNDLMASALYNARHEIISVQEGLAASFAEVAIVGPIDDEKDVFGEGYAMPPLQQGDLIAIMQAGACGNALASGYNGRGFVPEVLVSGAQHAVVRRRVAVAEQMTWENIPDWMVICRAA